MADSSIVQKNNDVTASESAVDVEVVAEDVSPKGK